jgi:hypothetical protein
MPKRQSKNQPAPPIVNVSTTTNVNAWDSAAFSKLLSEQAKANETAIKSLESSMASAGANQQQLQEQIAQSSMMKDIRDVLLQELNDKKIHAETEKLQKIQELKAQELQNQLKQEIELKQKASEESERLNKLRIQESEAIANMAKGMETFRSMGDRLSDASKKLKDNFGSMSALKTTALKAFNIGGIFNKSIAKEKFIQTQRKLGSEDDRSTLTGKFETANKAAKDIKKNEAEISQLKKDTGMSEADLAKRGAGKELFAKRSSLTDTLAGSDLRASSLKSSEQLKSSPSQQFAEATESKLKSTPLQTSKVATPELKSSPSQQFAQAGANEEAQLEQNKEVVYQTELLEAIAVNTGGKKQDTTKVKPAEGGKEGGGILSGLMGGGGGASKALDGMKKFGIGLLAVGAALFIAAKAFQEFGSVDWESIGKGMVALGGLVVAAIGLDKVKGSIIKGAFALGVLALAMYGMSQALGGFAELDWETIGKGLLAVAGIGIIAAVMGNAIKPIALGAVAIGLLGGALWLVGEAMQAVGKGFSEMTDGLTKLGQLDGSNLIMVGAGLAAIGAGMAVFGAGTAAAGIGNLVGGFLNLVTPGKSPVEQIMMMGEKGDLINQAGTGVLNLAKGMAMFKDVDSNKIKAIAALPIEKIAAMGAVLRPAGAVEGGSRANINAESQAGTGGGNNSAVVNTAVTTNNKTSQIIKSPIRNQESSVNSYLRSRYAT